VFVKIVIEEHPSATDLQTYLYQSEEISWEMVPGNQEVPLESGWKEISLPQWLGDPENQPNQFGIFAEDRTFLAIRLHDRKLLITVHMALLFIMNDDGKTIDVVRSA